MRIWRKVAIGLALALLVVVSLAAWALHSLTHQGAVYRYALDKARAELRQALGSGAEIGGFQLHFHGLSPSLDVTHLVIPGASPYVNPPLVAVGHVQVSLRVISLLHRAWLIQDVVADAPAIHIVQDAQGRTNLPQPNGGGKGPDLFTLGVRHAVIKNGTFDFNSRTSSLSADLRGLHLEAAYLPASQTYRGDFGYSDGSLQIQKFQPIPHSLETTFEATRAGLKLSPLHVTSDNGRTRLDASVYLADFQHPEITASYALSLDTNEVARILKQGGVPRGRIEVRGQAHWSDTGGRDALLGLDTSGDFSSTLLQADINGRRLPVHALQGSYRLTGENLGVTKLRATVLGGRVSADVAIHDLQHGAPGQASWQWQAAPLLTLVRWAAGAAAAQPTTGPLSGAVQAHGDARWHGGLEDLTASGQASLDGAIAAHPAPLPLHAATAFQFSRDQVQLLPATVVAAGAHLTATGHLATSGRGRAALAVEFTAPDLGQLETAAGAIATAAGASLPLLGLGGAAAFRGQISGSFDQPEIQGRVQAAPLRFRGTEWQSLSSDLTVSPQAIALAHGQLIGHSARVNFNLSTQLTQWNWRLAYPMQAQVELARLPLAEVGEWAGVKLPLTGVLDAAVTLSGSLEQPHGSGSIHVTRPVLLLDGFAEPLGALQLDLHGQGNVVEGQVNVNLPAGTVRGEGNFDPHLHTYQAQFNAPSLDLQRLRMVAARQLPLSGSVTLNASGSGSLADPGATIEITSPRLRLQDQDVTQVRLQATLAHHVVDAHLTSNAVATSLQGTARIALAAGYPTTATFDTGAIPLAALVAAVAPGAGVDVHGQTELHAHLDGPLANLRQLRATVTLPRLTLDYAQQFHLAAPQPIQMQLRDGVLSLATARLEGTGTQLQAGGTVPLTGGPMHVTARGTVDLKIVQAFAPALATGGELQLDLLAAGALPKPEVSGTIGVTNASLASASLPVAVQNGNGSLRLTGDRLAISTFQAIVGGGTLTASGGLIFRPRVQFDLAVRTNQIRLQVPPTVRETVGGNLSLTGTPESALLQGRFRVDSVTVTPQFDLTKVIAELTSSSTVVATPGSFLQNLNLNVAVSTPNQVHIVSRDFSTQASANVTVRGTAAQPVVLGRVNITSGDLIFRGNRYVLQSGALDFVNPSQTLPIVNITADTTIQQYNLHLNFQGPADNLRTSYTSDPALPPADIINLLAFGTTTEASAANPTPGNLGAENLIASAVSSQITDRIQRLAGISQLSVDPVLGGGQQNAGARITIQQRVTGNLFVTISTDVTSTQRNVIEIQYRLSPRTSLNAVRDQNGGFGVTTQFKKIW